MFNGAEDALGQWAQTSPETIESMLQLLAANEHDAAQSLLYRALIAGALTFASWAAELILKGGNRLEAGYLSDQHWLSREVVEAIAPIVGDQVHLQLEESSATFPRHTNLPTSTAGFARSATPPSSSYQRSTPRG